MYACLPSYGILTYLLHLEILVCDMTQKSLPKILYSVQLQPNKIQNVFVVAGWLIHILIY